MTLIEKASHASVIALCLASIAFLAERQWGGAQAPDREAALMGKTVSVTIPWAQNHVTLVAAMTTHCLHCIASVPLYRRLTELSGRNGHGFAFVFVSPEPAEKVQGFLAGQQLSDVNVLRTPLLALGISSTPTLLLVNSRGVVEHAFVGRLSESREGQLLALLRKNS